MSFMIFQNGKTFFQSIKTRSSKRRKNDVFPKGLTHGFGRKMAIFHLYFLGNKRERNVFYDILERINVFQSIKTRSSKRRKNDIFYEGVNSWFWSKNSHFLHFLFLGVIGQENVFYDILERKNIFLEYKNKKFNKTKK